MELWACAAELHSAKARRSNSQICENKYEPERRCAHLEAENFRRTFIVFLLNAAGLFHATPCRWPSGIQVS
jgi:hypothetical protein